VFYPFNYLNIVLSAYVRLPAAEQFDGVLVHGGLCPAQLPREQDRVLQHVRATHSERTVHRLYTQRYPHCSSTGQSILLKQCFGSGSEWIRIQVVDWIRIRIPNADPDPGGLKRAKMKKTQLKDR
jgi:hypothetical protein